MTQQDLAALNEYESARNPNQVPVVPIVEALADFARELINYNESAMKAAPEDIARLERPMHAAAMEVALLLLKAYNIGAVVSFEAVQS